MKASSSLPGLVMNSVAVNLLVIVAGQLLNDVDCIVI